MATEAFLQFTKPTIQGIQVVGETVDPAFKGAIQVLDFTFGAENATTIGSTATGAAAGKARLNEFVVRKNTDNSQDRRNRQTECLSHLPFFHGLLQQSGMVRTR